MYSGPLKEFILYILLATSICACSNEKLPSEIFLDDFFDEKIYSDEQIVCVTYPFNGDNFIQYLDRPFAKDTVTAFGPNSIVLTKNEKNVIIESLRSMKPDSAHVDFYINREITSSDTIDALLQNPKKGWSYFRKRYRGIYYSATKPIFLRNNTLCLFYYSHNCGQECGDGDFSIYRKTLFGWERYISFHYWIS